jgi:hypothetical protein
MKYELQSELRFRIDVKHTTKGGDVTVPIFITMKRVDNEKMISFRNAIQGRWEVRRGERFYKDNGNNPELINDLFNQHFVSIRVGNGDAGGLDVVEKADAKLRIRERIVGAFGYGCARVEKAESSVETGDQVTLDDLLGGNEIVVMVTACDDQWGENVIRTAHSFRNPTANDVRKYDKRMSIGMADKGVMSVPEDHRRVNDLYNSMIEKVDGYTINGNDVAQGNKSEWIGVIPYIHKALAIGSLFDNELLSKNE